MKRTAFPKPNLEKLKAKQKRKIAELFEGKQSNLYKVYSMTVKVKKAPKLKAKKKVSISKLQKKADSVFSQFIRIRDKGKCYTCGLQKHWKEMQNGHFVPRQYLSLRYDEINCHCQCYACNMLYNGQPSAYAKRLEEDFGAGTVARLESKRKDLCLWREPEYNQIIDKYTALVIDNVTK